MLDQTYVDLLRLARTRANSGEKNVIIFGQDPYSDVTIRLNPRGAIEIRVWTGEGEQLFNDLCEYCGQYAEVLGLQRPTPILQQGVIII